MGHNSGYSLSSVQLFYGTAAQPVITPVFIQLIILSSTSCSVFFTIQTHILLKAQLSHSPIKIILDCNPASSDELKPLFQLLLLLTSNLIA